MHYSFFLADKGFMLFVCKCFKGLFRYLCNSLLLFSWIWAYFIPNCLWFAGDKAIYIIHVLSKTWIFYPYMMSIYQVSDLILAIPSQWLTSENVPLYCPPQEDKSDLRLLSPSPGWGTYLYLCLGVKVSFSVNCCEKRERGSNFKKKK